jgi:hypothetical protein
VLGPGPSASAGSRGAGRDFRRIAELREIPDSDYGGGGRWHVADINRDPDNPKQAPRIDIDWVWKQIEQCGPHDPFVEVRRVR